MRERASTPGEKSDAEDGYASRWRFGRRTVVAYDYAERFANNLRRDRLDNGGGLERFLQLKYLRLDRARRFLRVGSLITAGVLAGSHVAFACHFLAAGHFGFRHLPKISSAGNRRLQRPRKQDGGGKPTS